MISLNFTLVIQLIVFLTVLWVLTRFLFKPVVDTLDERLEKTEGLNKKGREIEDETKMKAEEYQERLKEARNKAKEVRDFLKKEGLEEEKNIIKAGAKEAKDVIEEKKRGIEKEINQTKGELEKQIGVNSLDIVEKVLGRRIV
ncbi:MAG: ATP synthase F0 subunit B [Pseudomonadota bacterium]